MDQNQVCPQRFRGLDAATLRQALDTCYAEVPATRCASSGECCRLTEEEYRHHYATMFPLYRAEYASIAEYLREEVDVEVAAPLLNFCEERPRRCPFLDDDNRCMIYTVRPLICRTYGVMKPDTIEQAVASHRGRLPESWLQAFARREGSMFCPRLRVVEPEKVPQHAERLLWSVYVRELRSLSMKVRLLSARGMEMFRSLTERRDIPVTWSWGGFNTLSSRLLEESPEVFREYWDEALLVDVD